MILTNKPAVVVQMSPLAGAVGAVPCGAFSPAPPDAVAAVVTSAEKVFAPVRVCAPSIATAVLVAAPLRQKTPPPVVIQTSPVTGDVGVVPGGRLNPAAAAVLAGVVTSAVEVIPAKVPNPAALTEAKTAAADD